MLDDKKTAVAREDESARAADGPFVAAVEAIYEAATQPALWPHALQAMADCLGDIGAILIWRRDDGGFGTIVSPTLVEAQRDYEANGWYLQDVPSQRAVERELWVGHDAVGDRDAMTDEEMRTHPFYTQFLAKHNLRWRAAVGVAPDPRITVAIAIQRGGEKEPHSKEELAIATRLGRHAEKSLRLGIRLLDAELANVGLRDALARIGIGVFALDLLGRVVFSNPAAERLVGEDISIVNGRLRLGVGPDRAANDALIAQALRAEPADLVSDPKPVLLHRAPPDRPLVLYLLPVGGHVQAAEEFLAHTRAIVLVIDPDANEPADPAVVRDVLGVTLGEARVASLVGAGLPPREAAARLKISEETVRTALKRVFSKVGVSRQSELTALLTRLVLR